jgi:hypothetical protein
MDYGFGKYDRTEHSNPLGQIAAAWLLAVVLVAGLMVGVAPLLQG